MANNHSHIASILSVLAPLTSRLGLKRVRTQTHAGNSLLHRQPIRAKQKLLQHRPHCQSKKSKKKRKAECLLSHCVPKNYERNISRGKPLFNKITELCSSACFFYLFRFILVRYLICVTLDEGRPAVRLCAHCITVC